MALSRRHWTRLAVYGSLVLLLAAGFFLRRPIRHMVMNRTFSLPMTVDTVLEKYGPAVRQEFEPVCLRQGIVWPPARIQMLAFKEERLLELWGANLEGPFRHLATFPILGLSGGPGLKRASGDRQVPEGFYRLTNLNPQSTFHLSIRVDYPNEDDLRRSAIPREQMGGDIYIHGRDASIGCLAMGDPAIEKLFCLTALADREHRNTLIAPADFRQRPDYRASEEGTGVAELYGRLRTALAKFL